MNQNMLDQDEHKKLKEDGSYERTFELLNSTFAGFAYDFQDRNTFDDTPEQRRAFYEELLIKQGGFRFWLNTYKDMLFDMDANREVSQPYSHYAPTLADTHTPQAYNFWRDFVRSRINDERKKDILAPMEPPHPWGTKRPSLEQYYYEIYNLPHVDLIDVSADPIEEVTETGIRTKSGHFAEVDVIALATGFDSVTGSLAQLDIRGTNGESIAEHWKDGLKTSMGIALPGFPNMFFLYGPQAPTAFSNGPSCVQIQARWVEKAMKMIKEQGIKRFEAKEEVEKDWARQSQEAWDASLFPRAKSWYQGSNIPGRRVEPLNW